MDKKKAIIAAATASAAIVAVAVFIAAFPPGGGAADGEKPSVAISAQREPAAGKAEPGPAAGPDAGADADDAEEASESLAEYSAALGAGNTVLSADADADVDPSEAVNARALSTLEEGIAEFRSLPYHSEKSDDVDAVITKYFYSHPNIAYYVYNYTCEGKGSLDPESLRLFSSNDLDDGVYKAAFTLLGEDGRPSAYVDGYYDDGMSMYKMSDISMAVGRNEES